MQFIKATMTITDFGTSLITTCARGGERVCAQSQMNTNFFCVRKVNLKIRKCA